MIIDRFTILLSCLVGMPCSMLINEQSSIATLICKPHITLGSLVQTMPSVYAVCRFMYVNTAINYVC